MSAGDLHGIIDPGYLKERLLELLAIPSPAGFTEAVTRHVCEELERLGVKYELTRRGAIRAEIKGRSRGPDRAVVAHLDTLGAMVRGLKPNGRCRLAPIGHWSSRFAEGARVTLFTDEGSVRGTILPLLASGHAYGDRIDSQPVNWEQVELRLDERIESDDDLRRLGVQPGDVVAIDPQPEITAAGFLCSRHLDDKAGVASLLAALQAIKKHDLELPVDCHPLFTISEEVGSGASGVLHGDVAEMVAIDNAPPAPDQNATEFAVTVPFLDSSGPFDRHLSRRLVELAKAHDVPVVRDVFRYYRCDVASAVEAGSDIRTALAAFGVDASHGYERVHLDTLTHLARLLVAYLRSEPLFARDVDELGGIEGFPEADAADYGEAGMSAIRSRGE